VHMAGRYSSRGATVRWLLASLPAWLAAGWEDVLVLVWLLVGACLLHLASSRFSSSMSS